MSLTDHSLTTSPPMMEHAIDVLVVQGGPNPWQPRGNVSSLANLIDEELQTQPAQLVVLSELALTPYFAASLDRSWLTEGHKVADTEIGLFAEIAERHDTHIVVPFAERDPATDTLHNSTLILDRNGQVVPGIYCSGPKFGEQTPTFRKVHLSENNNSTPGVHEKYFFNAGQGFVVFDTDLGRIGPVICYDRSFPESWRAVADAGAQIVPVPIATARPERVRMLQQELSVAAVQNGVFVIAACKGGIETGPNASVTYSGGSMVIGPSGSVLAQAPAREGGLAIRARLDPAELIEHTQTFHYRRDRQPTAYSTPGSTPSRVHLTSPNYQGVTP
jgi:beta-ureidopropionase